YKALNEHLSTHLHSGDAFDETAPAFDHACIIYPFSSYKGWALKENEFIGVSITDLRQLPFSRYKNELHKLVALQQVSFQGKADFEVHKLLRAMDTNKLISMLPQNECAQGNEILMTKAEMEAAYAAYPHIIANTTILLDACYVDIEFGKLSNKNKTFYTGSLAEDIEFLRAKSIAGLDYRYPDPEARKNAFTRMEMELEVIADKQFTSYFLINWDIIQHAKSKNYYHVGRGSGANSIIAYLIGITDVDPIQLDLYFERFINKERSNPPDFDIDFSWTDRDDITAYIFKKFNTNNNVALLGSYNTFQKDATLQQLGKVYGLPPAEIGQLKKMAGRYPKLGTPGDKRIYTDVGEFEKQLFVFSKRIEDFPSHLSIHASGIIISEKPVTCYSATSLPPKGYATTHFSMLEAEDIGLVKFDILSQRGLGKIKDSLGIIKQNKGVTIDIHNVKKFYDDEKVKELLREGKAIGCFYVESPGMRMLLAKLRADDYLRLVAASSIIRPGVAQSGMMQEYIKRFREPRRREEARNKLPELYDLLRETYGVMVYQEDVIKVAHQFAGLTLSESDALRRGMSWKFKMRKDFMEVKDTFVNNCLKKGYHIDTISRIWFEIESFANFAFSKGHSASYAVESYQALYLKAHYPMEYMVATLNNGGGFYRKELYIHEARQHGAAIHLPCINNSNDETLIKGKTIYLGLGLIGELTEQTRMAVLAERNLHGPFSGLEDFTERVPLAIEQMHLLIRTGTFGFTGTSKKSLLWKVHTLVHPGTKHETNEALFKTPRKIFKLPELPDSEIENAFDEMELLGFTLYDPFKLLRKPVTSTLVAANLKDKIKQQVIIFGYLVNTKSTQTSKGERMYFGTFTDLGGQWIDTVHFPESARQHAFTGPGCYEIHGRVSE
ncbi:MAG: DNA polymerase III subunit alpha, partial [Bacteroidota bacterium]